MSEFNYGDNVEHLLYELSQYYEDEIKGSFEIRGEDESGVEGYEYIEVSLLADDAMKLIAELKAERDSLAAEGAARGEIIERLIGQYSAAGYHAVQNSLNPAQSLLYDAMQVLKQPATAAYLNSVRAEGVEMFAKHCDDNVSFVEPEDEELYTLMEEAATAFAAQLRAGKDGE